MMEGKLIEEEMRIVTGIWDYFVILDDYIMIDKEEFGESINRVKVGSKVLERIYEKPDGSIEVELEVKEGLG